MIIFYLLVALGLVIFFLLLLTLIWLWRRGHQAFGLDYQLLQVQLVKPEEEKSGSDWLTFINRSEQLFGALLAIKQPVIFEAAVHNQGQAIHFYLAVPRSAVDFAKRQVEGLFLGAQILAVPADYTIFEPGGVSLGAYLVLRDHYPLPLRTYRTSEIDTFAPIVSTLSKLAEVGEGAVIQLILQPADSSAQKNILAAAHSLREGKKLKDVLAAGRLSWRDFTSSSSSKKSNLAPVIDEEAVKLVEQKAAKPLAAVNLRLVTAAGNQARAEELLASLTDAFGQLTGPRHNQLKVVRPRGVKKLIYQFIFRHFDRRTRMVLNTEELASFFHLPTRSADVPRLNWARTAEAAPPLNLPSEGLVLGESIFRGEHQLIRLTTDDRRRHLYTVGQTGTGKSYLMLNLIAQDLAAGRGVAVIDPHGDLIDKILTLVPPERAKDVIIFDPGDIERPLGLNMLEYDLDRPEQKTFIINELLAIFGRLFDMKLAGGPMFERYMRGALQLLMEDAKVESATLMEVPRIFSDPEYRAGKVARLSNPALIDFWTKEAPKASGDIGLQNMGPWVVSKFDNFISNDYMRPIIGQSKSAFNARAVMDEGKILLVNLSKGRIGDLNASLLGMIVTGRLLFAALARVDQPETSRRDFYLYIDEFQNFTTDSISTILAEARKYKLNLIIAHQFIAQLEDNIREAVFGNVGSVAAFRVGAPDAEVLVKQFGPVFTETDLITIENRQAFLKLLINGEPAKPFKFRTLPVATGSAERAKELKELSRLTYGRPRSEVEQEILTRYRS